MKLNVFLNVRDHRQLVGLLYEENSRIFFEYAPDFLKSGMELSPFKLPLRSGVFEDVKRTFDSLDFLKSQDSVKCQCLLIIRRNDCDMVQLHSAFLLFIMPDNSR